MVADSGCTGNFMAVYDHLNNALSTKNTINAKFPNGQIIRSTMEGELYLPMLQNTAGQAHISPKMKHSLVSIGALHYTSCTVKFKIKDVTVVYKYDIIL